VLFQINNQCPGLLDQFSVVQGFSVQSTARYTFSAYSINGHINVFEHFQKISACHFVADLWYLALDLAQAV